MRDTLITRIQDAAKKLGRTPGLVEARQYKIYHESFARHFGTYNNLINAAGLDVNQVHRRESVRKNCLACNGEFETKNNEQTHCSRSCANTTNKTTHGKFITLKNCPECGNDHNRTSNYCSQLCKNLHSGRNIKKIDVVTRKGGANAYDNIRHRARSIAKHLYRNECVVCGYNTHTEVAHIKDIKDFPDTTTLYEINHPDNLIYLCKNHHWEFDHGLIEIGDILQQRQTYIRL